MENLISEPKMGLKVALIQMLVVSSKEGNLSHAEDLISESAKHGAKLVVLPEFFNTPIAIKLMKQSIEDENGETFRRMSELAEKFNIVIAAGSIALKEENHEKPFNTCRVFGASGSALCTYSKLHLVDGCDFGRGPGIILYESSLIRPGKAFGTFRAGDFKIGVGVCFDLKFPEVPQIYAQRGCNVVIYTSAFEDYETGPREWDVLNRARAIDNQMYILSVAPARNTTSGHISYAHSMIVDPFGRVLAQAGYEETIVYATLDFDQVIEARRKQDLNRIRRDDLYILKDLTLEEKS